MKRFAKSVLKTVCSVFLCALLTLSLPLISLGETGSAEYQFACYSSDGQEAGRLLFTCRTELDSTELYSSLRLQIDHLTSGTRLQLFARCFPEFFFASSEVGSISFITHTPLTFQDSQVFCGDVQEYVFEMINFGSPVTLSGFCCSGNMLQIEEDGDYQALSFGNSITSDHFVFSEV